MGLYEFHQIGEQPRMPARKKEDVLQIAKRWADIADSDAESWVDYDELEQDIHALAAVAIEALPD